MAAKYDLKKDPGFIRRVQARTDSKATVPKSPVHVQAWNDGGGNVDCYVLYFGSNSTFGVCMVPRDAWDHGPEYGVAVTNGNMFREEEIRSITNAAMSWLMLSDAADVDIVPYTQLKIEQMGYDLLAKLYPDRVAGKEEIQVDYQGTHRLFRPRRKPGTP